MKLRILAMTGWLLVAGGATAQEAAEAEQPAPAAAEAQQPSGVPAAERAALDAATEAYRDQMRKIEKLYSNYQTATKEEQARIDEQLVPLVAEAKTKVNVMVDAALEAFRAAPGQDPEITELLLANVEHQVVGKGKGGGGDLYERALPIVDALIDAEIDKPELPLWGVLSAVVTNDFDRADKYAKVAIERGSLEAEPGESEEARQAFADAIGYLQGKERFRQRWEEEKVVREAEAAADDLPRVKLTLSVGEVVIELFENQAPIATANFLSLAKEGYYDGLVFHRVIPRFMAQGGDPTGTGRGGPGHAIPCEVDADGARKHFRGTLSMAHAGRDTAGSQFFLCFVPTEHLDGVHTAFGRVVEGIELLGEIQVVDPGSAGPAPDRIIKAEVLRDRGHSYDYPKLPGR